MENMKHEVKKVIEEKDMSCPGCDAPQLHHHDVVVFSRLEDGFCFPTRVGNTRLTKENELLLMKNPSSRRGGINILFSCECGELFIYSIAQHKGITFRQSTVISDEYFDSDQYGFSTHIRSEGGVR